MTVTIAVYEADNDTPVGSIAAGQFLSAVYREVNSRAGDWQLRLPNVVVDGSGYATNPALNLLELGRVIRFTEGSFTGAGVIEDITVTVVATNEEAGEVTVVSGRGLAALFDKVRIRPDKGMDLRPSHPTRWFNFSADRLRDDDPDGPQGAWPFGVNQDPDYDSNNYFGRPEGYVDTSGQWVAPHDTRTEFAPGGTWYGRARFEAEDDYNAVLVQFAADDQGELWIDNVPVCRSEGVYLGGCIQAEIPLAAGEHLVGVKVDNLNELRTGFVAAIWSLSDGMPDELLWRADDNTMRTLGWPDDPPGFTPGEVVRLVVDEVQNLSPARLEDVTFSFISASDSGSVEWDEVVDITCSAPGDSILTFLEMLGETYLDWWVSPTSLQMNARIRGTRGQDRTATVIFEKGTCRRVTHEQVGSERATVALVTGANFAPFTVTHPDAGSTGVYEEVSLDFGESSRSSAAFYARKYLDAVSRARRGVTLELVPGAGPVPYEDFQVGDRITVPGVDGEGESHRVAGIGMTVGADSVTRWTVTLDQPRREVEERLAAIMRRQMPGAAGGRTILPSPTQPSFPANRAGSEDVHTWQFDGVSGNVQLYKNGVAVSGAVVVSPSAGATARVTLTDGERRFVKGADKLTVVVGSGDPSPEWVPPKGRWVQEMRATRDSSADTTTITLMVT